ncbi:MAG: hypothetical protein ACOH1Y_10245 [Propionicimonas sp.]
MQLLELLGTGQQRLFVFGKVGRGRAQAGQLCALPVRSSTPCALTHG